MIKRVYEPLDRYIKPGNMPVIYGLRHVGKITLLNSYLATTTLKDKSATGDDIPTQRILSSQDVRLFREYLEGYERES